MIKVQGYKMDNIENYIFCKHLVAEIDKLLVKKLELDEEVSERLEVYMLNRSDKQIYDNYDSNVYYSNEKYSLLRLFMELDEATEIE